MSSFSKKALGAFAVVAVGVAAVAIYFATRGGPVSTPPPVDPLPAPPTFPLPAFSESPFLNTGPDARFVGSDTCASCHPKNHRSYLLTPHSRALSDLDPSAEPPDATFHHQASGRTYRIYRQGKEFRHEEVVRSEDGKEIARTDVPIRYLIGSGNFCRTYLVEIDGFLHESPVTWYTAKKKWDMSPGYDFQQHWGFERATKLGCIACHAGQVEPAGASVHRLKLNEKAIGCESCHGPGSVHVDFHKANKRLVGDDDFTIVNPVKLPRARLEDVCASCHLNGPAVVRLRGRVAIDFRPGMPLADYRTDYRFDSGNDQMTVVGHIDQLRQSVCYQKSKEMTCLSCHDPHAEAKPKDTVTFYRKKCLDCHAAKTCSVPEPERRKKDAADNCATCHMPRGDTDIPHISFTHHRIGRHSAKPAPRSERMPELVPSSEIARLSPIDQKRNLGLAYFDVSDQPEYGQYAVRYRERARKLLEEVHAAGLRDGVVSEVLAEILWTRDHKRAAAYARETLDQKDVPPESRALALIVLANCHLKDRNPDGAIGLLEELVQLRRFADDWRLLGMCYLSRNEPQKALKALQTGLAIRPTRPDIHSGLAEAYRLLGDADRAKDHLEKAQWLTKHGQQ